MRSTQVVVICLLVAVVLAATFLSKPKPIPEEDLQTSIQKIVNEIQTPQGRAKYASLYMSYCASCHGQKMEGIPAMGAPGLVSPNLMEPQSVFRVAEQIYAGKGTMPSFAQTLSRVQIVGLSLWVVSTAKQMLATRGHAPPPTGQSAAKPQAASWTLKTKINLGAHASKSGTLFVFAKNTPTMRGPPLIAKRLSPAKTLEIEITPKDAMMGRAIANGTKLYFQARLDTDGNVMTKEGEPQSKVVTVVTGKDKTLTLSF